jgi:hypothetical protein
MSTCFVAGIVKGLIESNDATRHFGSLMAFQEHLAEACECGVITVKGDKIRVTKKGRAWYDKKRMSELPQCRAYMWEGSDRDWTV